MTNGFITKNALLAALTQTHEREVTSAFFGGKVLIREVTARQRLLAQQAAREDNPEDPDNALYQAMLIQMSVVDPDSGTRDSSGRIDPRTRTPLFSVDDVQNLTNARFGAVNELVEEITSLAGLGPMAMFPSDQSTRSGERNEGTRAEGSGDAVAGDADQGSGDTDRGSELPGGAEQRDGDTVE
jgi:hypothetical protein